MKIKVTVCKEVEYSTVVNRRYAENIPNKKKVENES